MFKWLRRQRPRVAVEGDLMPDGEPVRRTMQKRMYAGARQSRLTPNSGGAYKSSADAELAQSLTNLRGRSRALVRDSSYAKRAKQLVVNNVVGTGVGMQANVKTTRGEKNVRVNQEIEHGFRKRWSKARNCHVAGRLSLPEIERLVVGEAFEAGEVFVRLHPFAVGDSSVPLSLEIVESERLADEYESVHIAPQGGTHVRMGVEMDEFYRPIAYHFHKRHPGEIRFSGVVDMIERVPADQVIHLTLIDRWPQTRGEPWLHTVIRRMMDMDAYSEAEIVRARTQALTVGAIETPEAIDTFGELQEDGSVEMTLEAGVLKRLRPGEKLHYGSATSPNPALDGFMRYMLREIAAGTGVSYESLSRDYSQSNYSSSRLALLDDRDLWRHLQLWYIRQFREVLHEQWVQAAVLSRSLPSISVGEFAVNPDKFYDVRFKPRGWQWVDPTKEVKAFREAVRSGFTSVADVVASTAGGQDIEDVLEQRADELELMREMGLVFETSPEHYKNKTPSRGGGSSSENEDEDEDENEDDSSSPEDRRIANLR